MEWNWLFHNIDIYSLEKPYSKFLKSVKSYIESE